MAVLALVESGDDRVQCGEPSAECTGDVLYQGAAAVTEQRDEADGAGASGVSGALSVLEQSDQVAGTGTLSTAGTAGAVEGPDAVAASGTLSTAGTADALEQSDQVAGTGTLSTAGQADAVEGPDAVAASGTLSTAGTADAVEGPDAVAASGTLSTAGTADALEQSDQVAGTGTLSTAGQADALEQSDQLVAGSVVTVSGSVTTVEGRLYATFCGADTAEAGEPGAQCAPPDTRIGDRLNAAGTLSDAGTADVLEQSDQVAGTGTLSTAGTADAVEGPDAVAASGTLSTAGTADALEQSDQLVAAGRAPIEGVGAVSEKTDGVSAEGLVGGLDLPGLVANFDQTIAGQYADPGSKTPQELAEGFRAFYVAYSKTGLVPGVDVAAGGDTGQLPEAFLSDNTAAGVDRIAEGVAAYWKTVTTAGAPAHGGTEVLSVDVLNDAADFKQAIQDVITDQTTPPGGTFNFHQAIEAVVRGMDFVVTERVAGVPMEFFEKVV